MSAPPANHSARAAWSVDSIPYDTLDPGRVRDDAVLFYMVSSASLVEFASGVYTRNLTEFFHDDDEVVDWLTQSWEKEELQHGEALKRYVEAAWPDLDWESAYEGFIAELLPCYSVDRLAPTRALEMVGRCVVESGTAAFYRMMSSLATEPVLKQVASQISVDEVRHYKHFYSYYLRYREIEKPGRSAVLRDLYGKYDDPDEELENFSLDDFRRNGGIALHFTIHHQLRRPFLDQLDCFADFVR